MSITLQLPKTERLSRGRIQKIAIRGTENEMENVRQSYTIFEQQCQQMLEEYNNKYTTITAKLIRAKNSTVIKAWFAEFNYHTEMTHKQFDKLQEEQENKLAKTVNNIKRSTYEFANHVRLFSEDGCFASEQTKLFMKELKVVSKVSNKKYGSVEQEARRAFAISMDQFEELVNKFSKMFTTGLEETEFYEKSVKVLKSLQGLIREQVLNMKSLTNRLNRALKAIIVKEYQHVGDPACLDKYENLVDTVLQAGILLIESLLQLDPIINVRRIDFDALPVECFKECLFELAPVHQTSFVSKISHALYTTLEEIEELAKDFYDEHETIINTKRLQPTFNEFMTEMLAKYCYYHLQVEMLWLDQTNAFLKCIPKLHNSMTNFQNQFINQHHKYYSDQMASLQQDVINQTTKINETNIITLDGIYKKLKPLHGYVKNKELLEELQNEMVEACEQIRSNPVVEMLQEHREMLDRNAAFYRSDVNSVAKNLISIREECSSKLQLVPLLDQFEDKLRHMGNVVTLSDRSGDQSDITQIYRHKLDEIDIPKEFWITLHTTRSQDLFQSKAAEVIKGEAEENTIQVEDEYIKKFNDQYEQYINTIIGIEESWPAVVDSYERIFDGDVKKVVNLYKLKYDETN